MTYLGHQVPIQSQQIYFLQTLTIFAFYTISFSLIFRRTADAMMKISI